VNVIRQNDHGVNGKGKSRHNYLKASHQQINGNFCLKSGAPSVGDNSKEESPSFSQALRYSGTFFPLRRLFQMVVPISFHPPYSTGFSGGGFRFTPPTLRALTQASKVFVCSSVIGKTSAAFHMPRWYHTTGIVSRYNGDTTLVPNCANVTTLAQS